MLLHDLGILKTAAGITIKLHTIDKNEEELQRANLFFSTCDSMWKGIRKRCDNMLIRERMRISRRPANLPKESEVTKLMLHVSNKLDDFLKMKNNDYVKVRRYLSTLLCISNARRGDEVHRLRIIEVKDGINGIWLQNQFAMKKGSY